MALWQWLAAWRTRRPGRRKAAGSLDQFRPPSRGRRLVRVGIAFAVAVGVCGFLDLQGFCFLEYRAYILRQAVHTKWHRDLAEQARKQIRLVTLTDDTPPEFGPPPPRDCHAQVLRELTRAGVRVIAFDYYFDLEKPEDAELAAAAQESGRVVWGCFFEHENTPQEQLVLTNARLRRVSPHWGHLHVSSAPEVAVMDRIEAFKMRAGRPVKYQGQFVPALSLKAVMMAWGLENQPIRRVAGAWRIGDFLLPVDAEGCFPIRYLGPPSSTPYEFIYSGAANEGEAAAVFRQSLRDKIVLIGDATTMTGDLLSTPWGMMPGVEVHAQAIATLLQREPVREVSRGVNWAVLVLLVASVCLLTAFVRLPWAMLATLGLWGAYFVVNVWLFVDHGVWLHLVAPSLATVLATLGVLLERSLTVEREKNRMRGLLQRYLSPQTAEYVLAHPEKCHLGGEQVVATVLFSDIRGFTAMAEKWTPEEVVARLNEYFQAMTEIVFQYDSAVDKYMGDALMALFGIPVPHPDHPRRAVAAALDMQTALRELQAQWQARGLPRIDIGIGIHTGEMVVGNIGAQERQDFTVIGDAVNLASRVEQLNKDLHTRILITAATYEFIQDEVEVRGPLIVHVRGREEEVIVYEVLGWRNATADASGAAKNGGRERAQRIVPGFPGPTKIGPGSRVR